MHTDKGADRLLHMREESSLASISEGRREGDDSGHI